MLLRNLIKRLTSQDTTTSTLQSKQTQIDSGAIHQPKLKEQEEQKLKEQERQELATKRQELATILQDNMIDSIKKKQSEIEIQKNKITFAIIYCTTTDLKQIKCALNLGKIFTQADTLLKQLVFLKILLQSESTHLKNIARVAWQLINTADEEKLKKPDTIPNQGFLTIGEEIMLGKVTNKKKVSQGISEHLNNDATLIQRLQDEILVPYKDEDTPAGVLNALKKVDALSLTMLKKLLHNSLDQNNSKTESNSPPQDIKKESKVLLMRNNNSSPLTSSSDSDSDNENDQDHSPLLIYLNTDSALHQERVSSTTSSPDAVEGQQTTSDKNNDIKGQENHQQQSAPISTEKQEQNSLLDMVSENTNNQPNIMPTSSEINSALTSHSSLNKNTLSSTSSSSSSTDAMTSSTLQSSSKLIDRSTTAVESDKKKTTSSSSQSQDKIIKNYNVAFNAIKEQVQALQNTPIKTISNYIVQRIDDKINDTQEPTLDDIKKLTKHMEAMSGFLIKKDSFNAQMIEFIVALFAARCDIKTSSYGTSDQNTKKVTALDVLIDDALKHHNETPANLIKQWDNTNNLDITNALKTIAKHRRTGWKATLFNPFGTAKTKTEAMIDSYRTDYQLNLEGMKYRRHVV